MHRVGGQAANTAEALAATWWFAAGYLVIWTAFALAATFAQWALERASLLTPAMSSADGVLGGIVMIAAGLYQWMPLKDACLRQCKAPWLFIQRHGGFRGDAPGSLVLGARHGMYCVGCCWVLMALLFVGGVMNVLWIAAITIFVLAEKVVPAGRAISRFAGLGFFAWGCLVADAGVAMSENKLVFRSNRGRSARWPYSSQLARRTRPRQYR
jgi:predicted metal-binding membrane protein